MCHHDLALSFRFAMNLIYVLLLSMDPADTVIYVRASVSSKSRDTLSRCSASNLLPVALTGPKPLNSKLYESWPEDSHWHINSVLCRPDNPRCRVGPPLHDLWAHLPPCHAARRLPLGTHLPSQVPCMMGPTLFQFHNTGHHPRSLGTNPK